MITETYPLTSTQKKQALLFLSLLHMLIIAASNYLVQISFAITIPLTWVWQQDIEFFTTWGTFTFPFVFLTTDLTVRLFGADNARKIIFVVMFPALILSYVISALFSENQYQGLAQLTTFNLFVFRIALASFAAYVFGQLLDIFVFNRLRQKSQWWIAPSASMIFGSLCDTFLFFAIAFYQSSDSFLAEHWFDIGLVDYLFKLLIGLLFFVPSYGVLLNIILRKITGISTNS